MTVIFVAVCIVLLSAVWSSRPVFSALPNVDCSGKSGGWSGTFICPSSVGEPCSEDTCSSCTDCQLKFPGMAPVIIAVSCTNVSVASYISQDCTDARCSYCMGCDLTSLAYIPAPNSSRVAVCKNCNVDTTVYWNYGRTYTGTVRRGLCRVNLTCGSLLSTDLSTSNITYLPVELHPPVCPNAGGNPQLSSVSPRYGPLAGGTAITLLGEGLNYLMSISIGKCVCSLEQRRSNGNPSQLICLTTACNVTAGWYNLSFQMATPPFDWFVSDVRFQYKNNPTVISVDRRNVSEIGGLMVNFTGVNLGAAESPRMKISAACQLSNATMATFFGECLICEDERRMVCTSPNLSSVIRNADADCHLVFPMGLQFDGYTRYSSLIQLPNFRTSGYLHVVPAPLFEKFGVKIYDHFTSNMLLTIFGTYLTTGAQQGDYCVIVGKEEPGVCNCKIEQLVSTQLTCRLPSAEPQFDERNAEQYLLKSTRAVMVQIGNMQYIPGHVVYIPLILVEALVPLALVAVIAGLAACIWVRRRRRHQRNISGEEMDRNPSFQRHESNVYLEVSPKPEATDNNNEIPTHLFEKLRSFEVTKDSVELDELLGQGHFGKIFRAVITGRKQVAAKILKGSQSKEAVAKFLEEAVIMTGFNHPNVLGLCGVVLDVTQPIVLVPLMERGDLRSILRKQDFPVGDCLHFCLQIAQGMLYLSGSNFIHRDLAARNCLVSESYLIKIGDFGLAHDLDVNDYYRGQDTTKPLPVKWMAPESLERRLFTSASDVWSYGVVMWEIFSKGITPYADVNNYLMKQFLKSGYRLERPHGAPLAMYQAMAKCWNVNPFERPTFSRLVELVEQCLANGDPQTADRQYTQCIADEDYSYALCEHNDMDDLNRRSYLELVAFSSPPPAQREKEGIATFSF